MTPKQVITTLLRDGTVTLSAKEQQDFVCKPDGLQTMPKGTQVHFSYHVDGTITAAITKKS